MPKTKEWIQMNIEEIEKRRVNAKCLKSGNIIIVSRENNQRIDFVSYSQSSGYTIIKSNIIDYKKLKSAKTLENRLQIVIDSLRNVSIQFYFDSKVVDMILK